MRILTVRQPYADLILAGVKDVENRTWPVPSTLPQTCSFCGAVDYFGGAPSHRYIGCTRGHVSRFPVRIGIHSSARSSGLTDPAWVRWASLYGPDPDAAVRGALLGEATVTGYHHADDCAFSTPNCWCPSPCPAPHRYCSRWALPGVYHWTLSDPEAYEQPVPMRGRLGLWTPDDETADAEGEALPPRRTP